MLPSRPRLRRPSKPNSHSSSTSGTDPLAQLKADYLQKSAIYSEKHPLMKALKRQIDAAEKIGGAGSSNRVRQARYVAVAAGSHSEKLGSGHCQIFCRPARRSPREESAIREARGPRAANGAARADQAQPAENHGDELVALRSPQGRGWRSDWRCMDKTIRRSSDIYSIVDSQLVVPSPTSPPKPSSSQVKRRTASW